MAFSTWANRLALFIFFMITPSVWSTQVDGPSRHEICHDNYPSPLSEVIEMAPAMERALDVRCEGGDDPTHLAEHGFKKFRAVAKRGVPGCLTRIENIACKASPWRGLGLIERYQRFMTLAQKHTTADSFDVRVLPCIALKESGNFEPLVITNSYCNKNETRSTAQGLGQITYTTLKDLVVNSGFVSQVNPFDKPPYIGKDRSSINNLFDAMALNVELQIEVMQEIFRTKYKASGSRYLTALKYYRGYNKDKKSEVDEAIAYAKKVNKCFTCLQRVDSTSDQSVINCLSIIKPGLEVGFQQVQDKCKSKFTDEELKPVSEGGSDCVAY